MIAVDTFDVYLILITVASALLNVCERQIRDCVIDYVRHSHMCVIRKGYNNRDCTLLKYCALSVRAKTIKFTGADQTIGTLHEQEIARNGTLLTAFMHPGIQLLKQF